MDALSSRMATTEKTAETAWKSISAALDKNPDDLKGSVAILERALRDRRIAGAGLDVYEHEPTPAPGLTELENVVCIPHLGSATEATRAKMARMAAANLLAALRGEKPDNLVNAEALTRIES